jgi:hypothetical protein
MSTDRRCAVSGTGCIRFRAKGIVTIQNEHVEGVELHRVIVLATVQTVEIRNAVDAEQHRFAVQDE